MRVQHCPRHNERHWRRLSARMRRRRRIDDAGDSIYAPGRFNRLRRRAARNETRRVPSLLPSRSSAWRSSSGAPILARSDQSRLGREDQSWQGLAAHDRENANDRDLRSFEDPRVRASGAGRWATGRICTSPRRRRLRRRSAEASREWRRLVRIRCPFPIGRCGRG